MNILCQCQCSIQKLKNKLSTRDDLDDVGWPKPVSGVISEINDQVTIVMNYRRVASFYRLTTIGLFTIHSSTEYIFTFFIQTWQQFNNEHEYCGFALLNNIIMNEGLCRLLRREERVLSRRRRRSNHLKCVLFRSFR